VDDFVVGQVISMSDQGFDETHGFGRAGTDENAPARLDERDRLAWSRQLASERLAPCLTTAG
jgi:hypothetical protein